VIATTALLLFGYVLVDGSVGRDRETGVGELLATAPLSNAQYLLGKWLSNLAVLAVAAGVLLVATGAAYLLQGTGGFDPWAFASPFLLVTLPAMAVVAAAAVCFETIAVLRGTLGTTLYVALALVAIVAGVAPDAPLDLTGLVVVRDSMASAIASQYPAFDGTALAFSYTDQPGAARPFTWDGVDWTPSLLATRLPVLGVAGGFLAAATVAFDRFDGSGTRVPFWRRWRTGSREDDAVGDDDREDVEEDDGRTPDGRSPDVDVALSPTERGRFAAARVLASELRLALRGHRWWWYLACCLAVGATALAPLDAVRAFVVPLALLLPLSAWSAMGAREHVHRTTELVFVGSDPRRLLGATYLAGVVVGVVLTAPAAIRFVLAGESGALLGWGAGVLFLPAAALALGVWTRRRTPFEAAYLTAWYLGPTNGLAPLDYVGARPGTVAVGVPFLYLGLAVLALGAAVVGRHRA